MPCPEFVLRDINVNRRDGHGRITAIRNVKLEDRLALGASRREPAGTTVNDPDRVPAAWALNQHGALPRPVKPGIAVVIGSCSPWAFDHLVVASRLNRRFEHAYHLPALFGRHGQWLASLEVSGDIRVIAVPMSAYRRHTRLHDLGRA